MKGNYKFTTFMPNLNIQSYLKKKKKRNVLKFWHLPVLSWPLFLLEAIALPLQLFPN